MYEFISSECVKNRQLVSMDKEAFEALHMYNESMMNTEAVMVFFDGNYHCFRIVEVRVVHTEAKNNILYSLLIKALFTKQSIIKICTLHITAMTRDKASICDYITL